MWLNWWKCDYIDAKKSSYVCNKHIYTGIHYLKAKSRFLILGFVLVKKYLVSLGEVLYGLTSSRGQHCTICL